jgi:hypothetical protein
MSPEEQCRQRRSEREPLRELANNRLYKRVHDLVDIIVGHKANDIVLCVVATYAHAAPSTVSTYGRPCYRDDVFCQDVWSPGLEFPPVTICRGIGSPPVCTGWLPSTSWLEGSLPVVASSPRGACGSCHALHMVNHDVQVMRQAPQCPSLSLESERT